MTATRREVPYAAAELETRDALLQYCQETLLVKIDGLSDADLRQSHVPSGTTLLGIDQTSRLQASLVVSDGLCE